MRAQSAPSLGRGAPHHGVWFCKVLQGSKVKCCAAFCPLNAQLCPQNEHILKKQGPRRWLCGGQTVRSARLQAGPRCSSSGEGSSMGRALVLEPGPGPWARSLVLDPGSGPRPCRLMSPVMLNSVLLIKCIIHGPCVTFSRGQRSSAVRPSVRLMLSFVPRMDLHGPGPWFWTRGPAGGCVEVRLCAQPVCRRARGAPPLGRGAPWAGPWFWSLVPVHGPGPWFWTLVLDPGPAD